MSARDRVRAWLAGTVPGDVARTAHRPDALATDDVVEALDAAARALALATMERDTLRELADALRESNARLRAIVEGRAAP